MVISTILGVLGIGMIVDRVVYGKNSDRWASLCEWLGFGVILGGVFFLPHLPTRMPFLRGMTYEGLPDVVSVEGRIETIKIAHNGSAITMAYYNECQNQELMGTARVTEQTNIMIDGSAAKLSDLRNGERIRAEVRIENQDGHRLLTALNIHAHRSIDDSI